MCVICYSHQFVTRSKAKPYVQVAWPWCHTFPLVCNHKTAQGKIPNVRFSGCPNTSRVEEEQGRRLLDHSWATMFCLRGLFVWRTILDLELIWHWQKMLCLCLGEFSRSAAPPQGTNIISQEYVLLRQLLHCDSR